MSKSGLTDRAIHVGSQVSARARRGSPCLRARICTSHGDQCLVATCWMSCTPRRQVAVVHPRGAFYSWIRSATSRAPLCLIPPFLRQVLSCIWPEQ